MSVIKNHELESTQSYHNRGVHGYGRKRLKPEPEGFVCDLCCKAVVKDEGGYCGSCLAAEIEYKEE